MELIILYLNFKPENLNKYKLEIVNFKE